MLGNFTMHRAQQSCSVQSWEEGWQATAPWGTAPAPQTPAGPCPCPTGWDAELAPAPPSSREDADASRTPLLYQHLIWSPIPPRGQQQFFCRESRGFRAQGCCPAPAVAQRWPFPSRAALPPQKSHALHFSGLTHHRNQMPSPSYKSCWKSPYTLKRSNARQFLSSVSSPALKFLTWCLLNISLGSALCSARPHAVPLPWMQTAAAVLYVTLSAATSQHLNPTLPHGTAPKVWILWIWVRSSPPEASAPPSRIPWGWKALN